MRDLYERNAKPEKSGSHASISFLFCLHLATLEGTVLAFPAVLLLRVLLARNMKIKMSYSTSSSSSTCRFREKEYTSTFYLSSQYSYTPFCHYWPTVSLRG